MLRPRLQVLREEGLVQGGVISVGEVEWDQEKMDMEALEAGVVREGVATLVKASFLQGSGGEVREFLKGLQGEEVVALEVDLGEAEADIDRLREKIPHLRLGSLLGRVGGLFGISITTHLHLVQNLQEAVEP